MNKHFLLLFALLVVILPAPAHADSKSANRQTVLNKTTDYLATVGKSEQDKKEILSDRRDIRRQVRSQNEDRRKRVQTKKRMRQQEQNMLRKIHAQ